MGNLAVRIAQSAPHKSWKTLLIQIVPPYKTIPKLKRISEWKVNGAVRRYAYDKQKFFQTYDSDSYGGAATDSMFGSCS
jgi:hypothetical protein